MAGGHADRCRAYCGGIDLNFPLPKLLDSIRGYLDRGFNGVKIKIGQPTLAEDVERVAADLAPPDIVARLRAAGDEEAMQVDYLVRVARK